MSPFRKPIKFDIEDLVGHTYLRVDDERRVPRIAAALRPHKVERLERDVDGRHSSIVLVATEIGILMEFVIAGGSGATLCSIFLGLCMNECRMCRGLHLFL